MNKRISLFLFATATLTAAMTSSPATAADVADRDFGAAQQTVPDILSSKQKQHYKQVLAAIRGQRWTEAKALLDDAGNGPLNDFLRAELLLAAGSPRAEVSDILPILARSPQLPQAEQLGRLAAKRGAAD